MKMMDTAGNIIPLENEEDVLDFLIGMFLRNHNRFPCEHDRLLLDQAAHVFKCVGENCANPRLHGLEVGVERNRKQEFSSFQELLDFVPATFSPSRSAGPLLVLAFCFKYNAT